MPAGQGLAKSWGEAPTLSPQRKRGPPRQPSRCPSPGLSNHETLQQVTWGYRLPRPASCPAEVYALMLECWRSSPEERPAFAALQETLDAARRRLHPALT